MGLRKIGRGGGSWRGVGRGRCDGEEMKSCARAGTGAGWGSARKWRGEFAGTGLKGGNRENGVETGLMEWWRLGLVEGMTGGKVVLRSSNDGGYGGLRRRRQEGCIDE